MGLRDLVIPTRNIEVSVGDPIAVRGLSFFDFAKIFERHGPVLSAMFASFVETGGKLDNAAMQAILQELGKRAPEALALAVAMACDEPELEDTVLRLPMGDQAALIEGVFLQTFSSEAELKKLVETVLRALNGLNKTALATTAL